MRMTAPFPATVAVVLILAGIVATGTGCFARKSQAPETVPVPPPPEPEPEPPPPPPPPDPVVGELRETNKKLELTILERESEVEALEQRLSTQQHMLDDAIQEVVRAKAKLRSMESRAEAASEMAETEISFKALKDRPSRISPHAATSDSTRDQAGSDLLRPASNASPNALLQPDLTGRQFGSSPAARPQAMIGRDRSL